MSALRGQINSHFTDDLHDVSKRSKRNGGIHMKTKKKPGRMNVVMILVVLFVFIPFCLFMAHVNAQPDHPHKHTSFNIIAVMPDAADVTGAYFFGKEWRDKGPWTYLGTVVAGPGERISLEVVTLPSGTYKVTCITFDEAGNVAGMKASSRTATVDRR